LGNHKGKTWTKKSDEAKATTKKEMLAFAKLVKKFCKELNAFKEKKKALPKRKQDSSDEESYASAKSVNNFESDSCLFNDDDNQLVDDTGKMSLDDKPTKVSKDDESTYTITSKKDNGKTPSDN
jgi:hypothetical protein